MNKLKGVKLYDDRIMIKPDRAKKESDGGILLATGAQEVPHRGEVVLVGPGKRVIRNEEMKRATLSVKVGDRVLYQKYSGITFEFEDNKYLVMKEQDLILCLPPGRE